MTLYFRTTETYNVNNQPLEEWAEVRKIDVVSHDHRRGSSFQEFEKSCWLVMMITDEQAICQDPERIAFDAGCCEAYNAPTVVICDSPKKMREIILRRLDIALIPTLIPIPKGMLEGVWGEIIGLIVNTCTQMRSEKKHFKSVEKRNRARAGMVKNIEARLKLELGTYGKKSICEADKLSS